MFGDIAAANRLKFRKDFVQRRQISGHVPWFMGKCGIESAGRRGSRDPAFLPSSVSSGQQLRDDRKPILPVQDGREFSREACVFDQVPASLRRPDEPICLRWLGTSCFIILRTHATAAAGPTPSVQNVLEMNDD